MDGTHDIEDLCSVADSDLAVVSIFVLLLMCIVILWIFNSKGFFNLFRGITCNMGLKCKSYRAYNACHLDLDINITFK